MSAAALLVFAAVALLYFSPAITVAALVFFKISLSAVVLPAVAGSFVLGSSLIIADLARKFLVKRSEVRFNGDLDGRDADRDMPGTLDDRDVDPDALNVETLDDLETDPDALDLGTLDDLDAVDTTLADRVTVLDLEPSQALAWQGTIEGVGRDTDQPELEEKYPEDDWSVFYFQLEEGGWRFLQEEEVHLDNSGDKAGRKVPRPEVPEGQVAFFLSDSHLADVVRDARSFYLGGTPLVADQAQLERLKKESEGALEGPKRQEAKKAVQDLIAALLAKGCLPEQIQQVVLHVLHQNGKFPMIKRMVELEMEKNLFAPVGMLSHHGRLIIDTRNPNKIQIKYLMEQIPIINENHAVVYYSKAEYTWDVGGQSGFFSYQRTGRMQA
ncbi:MAG: hypothetical protein WC371_01765 [Parachlamydiales bacterium]